MIRLTWEARLYGACIRPLHWFVRTFTPGKRDCCACCYHWTRLWFGRREWYMPGYPSDPDVIFYCWPCRVRDRILRLFRRPVVMPESEYGTDPFAAE